MALTRVLREAWHFPGFVVSDAFAVRSLVIHGYARDMQDAVHKAFTAGLNMDMASGTYLKYLAMEVQQGHISMQQIDDAVRPILETKIRMGLFEHPYSDESRLQQTLNSPAHQELARHAVQRSMVLLRNEGACCRWIRAARPFTRLRSLARWEMPRPTCYRCGAQSLSRGRRSASCRAFEKKSAPQCTSVTRMVRTSAARLLRHSKIFRRRGAEGTARANTTGGEPSDRGCRRSGEAE